MLPDYLPSIPLERKIDLIIDLFQATQPIFITLHHMAPAKLKELKEKLKDLLDKGFMRPSSSPWDDPVYLLERKMVQSICVLTNGN